MPHPTRSPRAFISYTWENQHHVRWVEKLAFDLARHRIEVTLDQWHLAPGDVITTFMTHAVTSNDAVIIVCTSRYKRRADKGLGGVAFESDLMASEVSMQRNHRKFIPVLATGDWKKSAPAWLLGKLHVDMRSLDSYPNALLGLKKAIYALAKIPENKDTASGPGISSSVDTRNHEMKSKSVAFYLFGGHCILPEFTPIDLLRYFEERLQGGLLPTVVYFDVDGLLAVNQKFGERICDKVVEVISYIVSRRFDQHDTYRIINRENLVGGDQFACFVSVPKPKRGEAKDAIIDDNALSSQLASALAQQCIAEVRDYPWSSVSSGLFVTLSACLYARRPDSMADVSFVMDEVVRTLNSMKAANPNSLGIVDAGSVDEAFESHSRNFTSAAERTIASRGNFERSVS